MLLKKLWRNIATLPYRTCISYVTVVPSIIFILLLTNLLLIYLEFQSGIIDPVNIIWLMLPILTGCFLLTIFLVRNPISSIFDFFRKEKKGVSKLRRRIITAFSLGAAVPTIIVAVFSTYFFNFGVQAWFDDKISRVLEQSIIVGESYIEEHVLQLQETSNSISDDLGAMYYDLVHDPELFQKVIEAQAEMRSLDEAMVFKRDTNNILAQTSLSFSLSFLTIPPYVFEKVNKGKVVRIPSDPTKIRILIKLSDYHDTYLLIGRLIDSKIIDHINKANGTAAEYFRLKGHMSQLQVKLSLIFILLAMILLLAAVIWGRRFAERMVKPIRELVIAAEKVKNGDLTVQVVETGLKKDEIKILSSAFNRMVKQIDRQQRDLLIAQRALAWSDMARRVAHEIKNPLTPIQLSAERLSKKFREEVKDQISFEKYTSNIIKHSNEIKLIVTEFVNFARLPSPEFSKCEIVSIISHLVDTRRLINDSISYQVTSNVNSAELICDNAQLNRVLINLLQNAEEALEGVDYKRRIAVQVMMEKNFLTVSILDNGPGFDPRILKNSAKAYFTTKTKGTGLGLAIVERIVHDHFGSLRIFNREDGGGGIELTFDVHELKKKLK